MSRHDGVDLVAEPRSAIRTCWYEVHDLHEFSSRSSTSASTTTSTLLTLLEGLTR